VTTRASRVAALVRAMGVPCRKVPRRNSIRTLWTSPSTYSLRRFPRWPPTAIAKLIVASAIAAIREDHDDTARTQRLRGWMGWMEMVESGRWPKHLTPC
jgi:hypothetical protein